MAKWEYKNIYLKGTGFRYSDMGSYGGDGHKLIVHGYDAGA